MSGGRHTGPRRHGGLREKGSVRTASCQTHRSAGPKRRQRKPTILAWFCPTLRPPKAETFHHRDMHAINANNLLTDPAGTSQA